MEEIKILKTLEVLNEILDFWINRQPENLTNVYIGGFSEIDFNKINTFSSQKIYNEAESILQKYNSIQNKSFGTQIIYYNHSKIGETVLLLKFNNEYDSWEMVSGKLNGETASGRFFAHTTKKDSAHELFPFSENENVLTPPYIMKFCNNILNVPKEEKIKQTTLKTKIIDNHTLRLKLIHTYLKAEKYIDCNENDFLYWFGIKEMTKKPPKIHWLKADSTLKNVIHQLCGTSGEEYINIAFIFKNKYVTSNYKKDYIGSELFNEIKSRMVHAVPKI